MPNRLQSMSFKESNTTESLNTNAHTVIIFKNAGSQVLNSLENSIELLLWFLILYFCYEMFFCCCSVTKFSLTLCDPMVSPWNSPGKNTGVGCHSLLQRIFLTQGSKPGLLHCRQIVYCLSHQKEGLIKS